MEKIKERLKILEDDQKIITKALIKLLKYPDDLKFLEELNNNKGKK